MLAASISVIGTKSAITPAELTRMSMRPKRATTPFTRPFTWASSETSACTYSAPSRDAKSFELERLAMTTFAPAEEKRCAVASPMPELPPVIRATLLAILNISLLPCSNAGHQGHKPSWRKQCLTRELNYRNSPASRLPKDQNKIRLEILRLTHEEAHRRCRLL